MESQAKKQPKVTLICPDCTSKVCYYRLKTKDFICRRCGKTGKKQEFIVPSTA